VPLADPLGDVLDLAPLGDVAKLPFRAELVRDGLQTLLPAGQKDAAPPVGSEPPRDRRPDPARASGDYGVANVRRVSRLISTVSSIGSA
jgi:hypothetical protein